MTQIMMFPAANQCRACGHTRIMRDLLGREYAGGAHVWKTGLCWFCWKMTSEAIISEQQEMKRRMTP